MCLYIDGSTHKVSKAGYRRCGVATRDILVWKVLKWCNKNSGSAPYRGHYKWFFGERHYANKMRKRLEDYTARISFGLHAVLNTKRARELLSDGFWSGTRICPAVIPKGSKLFFGDKDDIVATEMIVYRDLAEVVAAHGPIAKKVHRTNLI